MNARNEAGTSAVEARLRHTLQTVADATVVAEATAIDPTTPVARVTPLPSGSNRAVLAWRLVGAAAVLALLVGSVAFFSRGASDTVEQPAGLGTVGTTTPVATTTLAAGAEELDPNGVPIRPSAALNDHWHAAYGLYVCDHFLEPLVDVKEDHLGIHTHGEGVIHIHPFAPASSGRNATLTQFADQVGLELHPDGFRLPTGDTWSAGAPCNGSTDTTFGIFGWSVDDPSAPVSIHFLDDTKDIWLRSDRMAFTIAIVPMGVIPPKPPSIVELDRLADVAPPHTTGTTCIGGVCTSGPPNVAVPTTITTVTPSMPPEPTTPPTPPTPPTMIVVPPLPTEYCTGYDRWKTWMMQAPGSQSTLLPEFRTYLDRLVELAPTDSLKTDIGQLRDLWSDPNAQSDDGSTEIAMRIDEATTSYCTLRPE